MAGLKELRVRISSIASTKKITSAMKMVAAARLRRANESLDKSENYHQGILTIAGRIFKNLKDDEIITLKEASDQLNLAISMVDWASCCDKDFREHFAKRGK